MKNAMDGLNCLFTDEERLVNQKQFRRRKHRGTLDGEGKKEQK